ncbi:ead/Ea22-like family protein [Salmonella enterica subsp. enterica serovar Typhimurium]|nr:ead/Ea22-like family protein [Salmonella enterica]EDK9591933.1 ead/Ea22-like family protein [Salmonella enterica subsp. enterica serovar Typhimurium]
MTALNKQALREEFQNMQDHYSDPADRDRQIIYIAAEALLDDLESANALNKHLELATRKAEGCSEALRRKTEAAEKRIAELEARTVCLPKLPVLGSNAEWYEGFAAGASGMRNECADAIRAAGIGVKGE